VKLSKFRYIFIGLIAGLIIGLGISSISESLIKSDYLIELKDLLTFNSKVEPEKEKSEGVSEKKLSEGNSKLLKDTVSYTDSLNMSFISDSSHFFNSSNSGGLVPNPSDIVVYRDKMIYSKYIKVKGLSDVGGNKINLLDSLLMNDTPRHPDDMLLVEFWKSPVNYKGYKLSDNKLILFGIDDINTTSIEVISNEIYLSYKNKYFLLEYTNDFKSFISSGKRETDITKKTD